MECCPDGSWGALETPSDTYKPHGRVERMGDMDVYHVGEPIDGKCILWNYDIFGFNGGRTKMLCDFFSERGYLVMLPDFYRKGDYHDPKKPGAGDFLKSKSDWRHLVKDVEAVLGKAKSMGGSRFAAIGTCWGTYMVVKECAMSEFKAGVSMHPAHTGIAKMSGDDETRMLKAVKCPQLFMPAGNDHANVKPGGLGTKILGKNLEIVEFPEMVHGWTTRGSMRESNVNRDVKKAIEAALTFFAQHV